ncbi:hypothetical protein FHS43_006448 [Streptosporangium becharense]|uniref:Uncharacterized protein n=1 Tax=Streptosporangium becharense TaxID=1816182 RepID=A0A7W9ILZ1_9ACTN|nr:hypothetical protein [Streptosporangium becharense]MBB2915128.1 hypothetical protein [Streptosporangium becharense]MBB5822800.1 hypothetical protein [Streptosporangium becharense]
MASESYAGEILTGGREGPAASTTIPLDREGGGRKEGNHEIEPIDLNGDGRVESVTAGDSGAGKPGRPGRRSCASGRANGSAHWSSAGDVGIGYAKPEDFGYGAAWAAFTR